MKVCFYLKIEKEYISLRKISEVSESSKISLDFQKKKIKHSKEGISMII